VESQVQFFSGTECVNSDSSALTYAIPDNGNSLFRYSLVPIDSSAGGNNTAQESGVTQYHMTYLNMPSSTTVLVGPPPAWTFMGACGDDFSLIHYYGPPLVDFGTIS